MTYQPGQGLARGAATLAEPRRVDCSLRQGVFSALARDSFDRQRLACLIQKLNAGSPVSRALQDLEQDGVFSGPQLD